MSEREQMEWCQLLGKTTLAQVVSIRELLAHAIEDRMSAADRTICVRQSARLEREHGQTWGMRPRAPARVRRKSARADVEGVG